MIINRCRLKFPNREYEIKQHWDRAWDRAWGIDATLSFHSYSTGMIVTAGLELILLLQIKSNDESSLPGDKSNNEALLCGGENDDTKTGENERCLQSSVAHRRKLSSWWECEKLDK